MASLEKAEHDSRSGDSAREREIGGISSNRGVTHRESTLVIQIPF